MNIIVLDNHGFSSIGGLSRACGSGGFGTEYRKRQDGQLQGEILQVDFAANAASLGAHAVRARTRQEFAKALEDIRAQERTSVIVIETDINARVPGYESWWDVAVAEVSQFDEVRAARKSFEENKKKERNFF